MARGSIDDALNITKFLDIIDKETGAGCKVVIIDTGISPDFDVEDCINLTDESMKDVIGHGSIIQHVITSILPEASIYFIKIPDPVPDHLLITALNHALKWRPHAINLSFSSEIPTDGTDPSSVYVDYVSQESAVCISAGNGGPRLMSIGSPATAREAITVGATDTKGRLWVKSSRGPTLDGRWKPNVVAPTNYVIPELGDESWPGTSFSTPLVTALAAILMRDVKDSYVARRIIELTATSIPLIFTGDITLKGVKKKSIIRRILESWSRLLDSRNLIGMGLINAAESVKFAQPLRDKLLQIA